MTVLAFVLLWLLATVDGGFAGFRDAAGRDPRIRKRAWYRTAIVRGSWAAQLPAAATGATAAVFVAWNPSLLGPLAAGARTMIAIYAPYATLVLLALAVYVVAGIDLRALTTVTILGPFTLIRPLVIAAGVVTVALTSRIEVAVCAAIAGAGMLVLERWLDRRWRRNQFWAAS